MNLETENNKIHSALKQFENLTQWKFNYTISEFNTKFDGQVEFLLPQKKIVRNVEYKPTFQAQMLDFYIDKFKEQNILLISNYFTEKTTEKLRENNIAYLDQAGNAFLQEKGDIFILVKGNKPTKAEKSPKNRLFQLSGLKFLFYVLQKPEIINLKQREIQKITGLSLGSINKLLNNLKEARFLHSYEQTKYLSHKEKLLERWVTGYEEILRPSLKSQKYKFINSSLSDDWQKIDLKNQQSFWGGEPAADLLTNYLIPEKFTIYTHQSRTDLMRYFKIIPDSNGNIEILDCFWKEDSIPDNQSLTVPPLLVYADLKISGDSRNIETMVRIYEKYLSSLD